MYFECYAVMPMVIFRAWVTCARSNEVIIDYGSACITSSSRKESSFPAEMPLIKSVGPTNRQLPATPRKCVALYQRTPRLGCDLTNAKTYKLPWKTGTQASFQKPRLQPVSFFFKFVRLRLLCIFFVIYTASFNVLSDYFCFTQFGDRFYCLNFDKFRYSAPLMNQWKTSLSAVLLLGKKKRMENPKLYNIAVYN